MSGHDDAGRPTTERPTRKWPFGRLLVFGLTLGLWALLMYGCVRIGG